MYKKNIALKRDDGNGERHTLRVEHAAEKVSNDLDKVIHERMRLGIISALAANEKLSFNDLKSLLDTTDGNVSVHARKLEDAGYLTVKKSFLDRVPLTEYKITKEGRKALEKYLDHMEALINAMKGQNRQR
ncbi:MAG: transcriptional regulator [Acidobacteria bacterium]|nr:transcriptional regulator [Acidobacteriota bacterium]